MLLSDYELDITKELFNIGLANSADAFSKLTKEKVLINGFDLAVMDTISMDQVLQEYTAEPLCVLTTAVRGNLQGISYLLFDQRDLERIGEVFMPKVAYQPGAPLSEFQEALLLELDNILSAAVVTQLSNFLNVFTYGDVPALRLLTASEALASFKAETRQYDVIFNVRARFKSYQTNLQPSFVWFFSSDFIALIKQLIQDKQQLSLLKNETIKV